MFPGEKGGLLGKSNFTREMWTPIRTAASIPTVRFHDLRHTCAVLLLMANVNPKVVQQRLGHASIVITMDTYAAWMPSMQAVAANAMGEILGRLTRDRRRAA